LNRWLPERPAVYTTAKGRNVAIRTGLNEEGTAASPAADVKLSEKLVDQARCHGARVLVPDRKDCGGEPDLPFIVNRGILVADQEDPVGKCSFS
jgi:hypothetical protein